MNLLSYFPIVSLSPEELWCILPILAISFGGLFSIIGGATKNRGRDLAFSISLLSVLICMGLICTSVFKPNVSLLRETLIFSPFTRTISLMALLFSLMALIHTHGEDQKEGIHAEVYGLILFSTAGMMLILSTHHLLFTFISLEIMSFAVYVLVAMRRLSRFSSEAGLKYFILGGLGSAFFLYGTSLIFGATGSLNLVDIKDFLLKNPHPSFIYYVGMGLILAAMLFKIGAFPFHGWVPDVYQGAPSHITGFMGAAVKFTAFVAFARLAQHLIFVDHVVHLEWFQSAIGLVCVASMIYGNFVAIAQNEIKRMLSFSTIAHTGYLLLGLYAMGRGEVSSQYLILYLFFYALSNQGAFAVISIFEDRNQKDLRLDQMAGLGMKYPLMGALLTVFILSMAGIPLTAGFIGKYSIFSSAIQSGEIPLVVIAVLTSVVSVFYYLRIVVVMFMKEGDKDVATFHVLKGASFVAIVTALATLQFGVFPRAIIQFIKQISQ